MNNLDDRSNKVKSISGGLVSESKHPIDEELDVCSVNGNEDEQVSDKKDSRDDFDTLSTIKADEKLLLNDFLAITTLHGIKYVYNKNYSAIRRFCWVCVMMTSYVLLILTAKEHIIKYRAKLTNEEFSTTRKVSISFPAVTICNSNPVKASLVGNLTMNAVIQVIIDGSTKRGQDIFGSNETDALDTHLDEFLLANAHQASDMILECAWKRADAKECGAANFSQKMTSAGVCYTFNDGDFVDDDDIEGNIRLEINRGGTRESFWIRLNVEVDEYVSALSPEGIGFKLVVHRPGDVPMVTDAGVAIMPGVRTLIAMKKQTVRSKPHPYDTDCRDTPLDHYPFYSEGACLTECETKRITGACGCKLPHMAGPYPVCTLRQYEECVIPAFEKDAKNLTDCNCQRACYSEQFHTTMSYLKAPGKRDTQQLQNQFNWTKDDVTSNIAELEIYFADMNEYQVSSEVAYTIADLWGDLGGIIGVHLGASLLTLFEFVDYAIVEEFLRMRYLYFYWRKIKSFCSRDKKDKETST